MPKKELSNPHLTIWKALLAGLYLNAVFTFFSWGGKIFWKTDRYVGWNSNPPSFPPLTVGDILLGSGWILFFFWLYWVWRPRRKHARWHRWLASLIGSIYFTGLLLLGGSKSWNTLINNPWNWAVNDVLLTLFILAWLLPAASYAVAKKLVRMQWAFNFRILSYGGLGGLMVLAGVLGASYGMDASRNGDAGSVLVVMGFFFSLIALFAAQYSAEYLWRYRPWQKDEEE